MEDEGRGGQATVLPFSAYGAMGWKRDEYEPNSGSSQSFWLLFYFDDSCRQERSPMDVTLYLATSLRAQTFCVIPRKEILFGCLRLLMELRTSFNRVKCGCLIETWIKCRQHGLFNPICIDNTLLYLSIMNSNW